MDDGDILRTRDEPIGNELGLTHQEAVFEVKETNESNVLLEHCAGTIDMEYVNSLPNSEKKRFYLSRRIAIPPHVARKKLEQFFDDFDEEAVMVLSAMAKCYVAQTVEGVRSRQMSKGNTTSNPISVSELLNGRGNRLGDGLGI